MPRELGGLAELGLSDLRDNNFTGSIPVEISCLSELKHLLLFGHKIEVHVHRGVEMPKLSSSKWLFVDKCTSPVTSVFGGLNRKFGNGLKLDKALHVCQVHFCGSKHDFHQPWIAQTILNLINSARGRILDQSSNFVAAPVSVGPTRPVVPFPSTLSSGTFPAVPHTKEQNISPVTPPSANASPNTPNEEQSSIEKQEHSTKGSSGNFWIYMIIIIIALVAVLVIIAVAIYCFWRAQAAKTINPWKTGTSGQLQKAFVKGVPKLNRPELETACEDFTNIINNFNDYTVYKGTLSSEVEIDVVSTAVTSSKECRDALQKKISTLSRVNHKNFINLIGFYEEEEPFTRMMIFEYAPNGSLFEHLHVKGDEHLDWSARVRIIMGIAYSLQYMHHDLNPPISHPILNSSSIYLTDDFATKVADINYDKIPNDKSTEENGPNHSLLVPNTDPETNVYNFGMLLLEIISGKLPYSEEQGHLNELAVDHIKNNRSVNFMIDPILQSHEKDELDVICEVIQDCIQTDARLLRPTMKDIVSKLRGVINISPETSLVG